MRKKLRVNTRRKKERKTDYKMRLKLVSSDKNRVVVRKSLNSMLLQITRFDPKGDKVILSASTKELNKYGYKGHKGNSSTAYLVGLLLAVKAQKNKINAEILDIGLNPAVKGSSLFATLKGLIDGGLNIKHSESILPKNERIMGEHISNYAKSLKDEERKKQFSLYYKNNLNPEDLPKHIEEIKNKILKEK